MHLASIDDVNFMKLALKQANKALQLDEVPIGAIVVSSKFEILGMGYNLVETKFSQTEHAEIRAIKQAGKALSDWRLINCTIYITLQPCIMCLGLICLSRIERIVYGATSELMGCDIDKHILPELYKKHIKGITGGILEDEALLLLRKFFKKRRK